VDTHVAVLRRKLGHAPQESGYVVTVAEAGCRLRERPACATPRAWRFPAIV